MRALALAAVLVTVTGCGEREEPAPPPAPPAATSIRLAIAVDVPDTLRRAIEAWAGDRRAQVEWRDPSSIEGATLAEVDAIGLVEGARADAWRPMPTGVAEEFWFAAAGQWEGTTHGLPWRGTMTGVAARDPVDWPILARLGEALVIEPGTELDAFIALAAASGAGPRPGEPHDVDLTGERSIEALSFLRRLATRARAVDPASTNWDAAFVTSASRDAVAEDVRIWGFPSIDGDGEGRAVAHPRVLVVPRTGDHGDLGIELARWLAAPARAVLLHGSPRHGIALHRDAGAATSTAAAEWVDLRARAVLLPTLGPDARAWVDELEQVVRAAIERRRSPDAALQEATARRWSSDG